MKKGDIVWVKGRVEEEIDKVIILLDKNDKPIYYTTVGIEMVNLKDE